MQIMAWNLFKLCQHADYGVETFYAQYELFIHSFALSVFCLFFVCVFLCLFSRPVTPADAERIGSLILAV